MGIDGSGISMGDEEELESVFSKSNSKHGKSRFPIANVVFVFMLNTMIVVGHKIGSYKTSENTLFSKLISQLLPGDLIVRDRRYAGAKLYVDYIRAGIEFITRAHQRLKVELLKVIEVLGKDDFIVELPLLPLYWRKLIHWLILKAAKKHKKDSERISVSATLRLTASYSLKMSVAPFWMLPLLYEDLLEKVGPSKVPYRTDRHEPRMKRRDQKHYPILKKYPAWNGGLSMELMLKLVPFYCVPRFRLL